MKNFKINNVIHIILKFLYNLKYNLSVYDKSEKYNRFGSSNNLNCRGQKVIIGFIKKKSSGWILQYLFNDLSKFSLNYNFVLCYSFNDVYKTISKYKYFHIFSLHQSFIKKLFLYAIPSKKITTFYTHTRINNFNLFLAKKINKILPMNSFESNLLELEGIKRENLKIFYAGYDHNIFYPLYLKDKKFDVIFVCKYDSILESYYSRRKNYTLLINLVNSLSKSLKVAIIGKDWDKCQSLSKSENISTLNPKHSEYMKIYNNSKIFVNLSKYEGGPVSLLESMACGCTTVSFPTGFSIDFFSDELNSFLIPFNSTLQEIECYIKFILNKYMPLDESKMQKRIQILKKARFQNLTSELEKIADLNI